MPWYYANESQRMGPYTDQEFEGLAAQGTVRPDTLVWRDGMANWLPWAEVQQAPAPSASVTPQAVVADPDRAMVVCSSCHRAYPEDEVLQYQGAYICAACKPLFVQQLREGAQFAGTMVFAGFWIRFASMFIDGIILAVFIFATSFVLGLAFAFATQPDSMLIGLQILVSLGQMAVPVGYFAFFHGKFGATPGKMACGIRVVTADGQPITYLRALARAFAWWLSYLTIFIGFIIAGFDEEKRALHDHICGTRVIRK